MMLLTMMCYSTWQETDVREIGL